MKKFFLVEQVLRTGASIIIGCPYSDVPKHMKREFVGGNFEDCTSDGRVLKVQGPRGETEFVLWLNKLNNLEDIGTLAHEIFHLVTYMLEYRGFKLSDESDEAYAHLTGYYMREILNYAYPKQKKPRKKRGS